MVITEEHIDDFIIMTRKLPAGYDTISNMVIGSTELAQMARLVTERFYGATTRTTPTWDHLETLMKDELKLRDTKLWRTLA